MRLRLVVLDRDETLIRLPIGRRYVAGEDSFELMPGAAAFVAAMNRAGIVVVVATNQQGVALAEYPEIALKSVQRLHERIQQALVERDVGLVVEFVQEADRRISPHPGPLPRSVIDVVRDADCGGEGDALNQPGDPFLKPAGARIARFYVCPHAAAANCGCRKPQAGLLTQALEEFGVSPAEAAVIGDRETDMQAGAAAGIGRRYWLNGAGATSHGISKRTAEATVVGSFGECLELLQGSNRGDDGGGIATARPDGGLSERSGPGGRGRRSRNV